MLKLKKIKILIRIIILSCVTPILKNVLPLKLLLRTFTPLKNESVINPGWLNFYTEKVLNILYIGKYNCMTKSLIIYYLLNRYSIKTSIVFGIRKDNKQLDGHSWVENNNVPLFEERDVANKYHSMLKFDGEIKKH